MHKAHVARGVTRSMNYLQAAANVEHLPGVQFLADIDGRETTPGKAGEQASGSGGCVARWRRTRSSEGGVVGVHVDSVGGGACYQFASATGMIDVRVG